MKKIIAVTVNYNREDATKSLLKSLDNADTEGLEFEIIVVDNSPIKIFSLPKDNKNVSMLRPGTNTGFAGGNNLGIKEALKRNADYVLLVNDDTVVDKRMIKNLFDNLEKEEKIGVAAPKIYFSKGQEYHKDKYKENELGHVIWFAGGYNDWNNATNVHRGVDEVDHGQYDKVEKIDFATGCCMMIKSKVFEKVGLFDEKYFLYYEDGDLNMRIQKAGFEIVYVPSAFMYHDNASSSGGAGSSLHDYFLTRNQMLFGMRYAPLRTKAALVRQSLRLLKMGREYQKKGIRDFYLRRFGKGTYFEN